MKSENVVVIGSTNTFSAFASLKYYASTPQICRATPFHGSRIVKVASPFNGLYGSVRTHTGKGSLNQTSQGAFTRVQALLAITSNESPNFRFSPKSREHVLEPIFESTRASIAIAVSLTKNDVSFSSLHGADLRTVEFVCQRKRSHRVSIISLFPTQAFANTHLVEVARCVWCQIVGHIQHYRSTSPGNLVAYTGEL